MTHRFPVKSIASLCLAWGLLAVLAGPLGAQPRPQAGGDEPLRHYMYGRWLELDGQLGAASEEYFRALSLDPGSVDLLVTLASVQARMGEPDRSLELANRALQQDSTHAQAQWLRGAALFNLRRLDEAMPALRSAARLDSSDQQIARTLARAAEVTDQIDVLESAWSRLTRLDEEDGEAWFQLATAQARQARFGEADSSLARSLALQPSHAGSDFLAAWIHENLGRTDDAIEDYRRHLLAHPEDSSSRRRLTLLLARSGRAREAWPEAQRLLREQPDEPDVLLLAGQCAFDAGHRADGERALERLRDLDRDDPGLVERSVLVLSRYQRGAEAVRLADAWSAAHPTDPRGRLLMARARAIVRDLGGAEVQARAAIVAAPDSLAPRVLLARILEDAERWPQAADAWGDVLARVPHDVSARLERAHCLDRMDQPDSAAAEARRVLLLAPDSAPAMNFIGYLWAERNRNLVEAKELLERALALEPDNGAYVDSWGWLLYRLGRLSEARSQLERALALTGGDPVIHEHLGDVFTALRDTARAREQYHLSLSMDRGNRRVRSKLEGLR